MRSLRTQRLADGTDCVPVASGERHPEHAIQHGQIADDLHVAPVHADDEAVIARDDFQEPPTLGREIHGQGRYQTRASGQDAHETDNIGSHGKTGEIVLRQQPDDLTALTDHHFGFERKPAFDFSAQLGSAHAPPDHERAGRPDVDEAEMPKLFSELSRPKGPVTADVETPQKNDECHEES